jgi:hypothetical protein
MFTRWRNDVLSCLLQIMSGVVPFSIRFGNSLGAKAPLARDCEDAGAQTCSGSIVSRLPQSVSASDMRLVENVYQHKESFTI